MGRSSKHANIEDHGGRGRNVRIVVAEAGNPPNSANYPKLRQSPKSAGNRPNTPNTAKWAVIPQIGPITPNWRKSPKFAKLGQLGWFVRFRLNRGVRACLSYFVPCVRFGVFCLPTITPSDLLRLVPCEQLCPLCLVSEIVSVASGFAPFAPHVLDCVLQVEPHGYCSFVSVCPVWVVCLPTSTPSLVSGLDRQALRRPPTITLSGCVLLCPVMSPCGPLLASGVSAPECLFVATNVAATVFVPTDSHCHLPSCLGRYVSRRAPCPVWP